jgi:uncharacterized repeat protein (TIGR03803 family)
VKHGKQHSSRNYFLKECAVIALTLALLFLAAVSGAQAQNFQVIHTFTGGADGAGPNSTLLLDAAGNLYGTARGGGNTSGICANNLGCGVVFKMKSSGSGWVLTPLYTFAGDSDGAGPAGVVFGPDGSLYGTTYEGGVSCPSNTQYGCGTVFNLRPSPSACKSALCPWNESVLYRFAGGSSDGAGPNAPVVFDHAGNIYGTTVEGGLYTLNCEFSDDWCGTVFELSPSNGGWTETVPYFFDPSGSAGQSPEAGLAIDAAGNLYGTALVGGVNDGGTVYELSPSGSGWVMNTLYSLPGGSDGGTFPQSTPIFDPSGNLYATTQFGGPNGGGTVFELSPSGGGWNYTLVDGLVGHVQQNGPLTGVTRDSAGNLYGTAFSLGGINSGLIFKLSPSNGGWTYTTLHQFDFHDGCAPVGGVTVDAHGNLYGTASGCGADEQGVVWEITP